MTGGPIHRDVYEFNDEDQPPSIPTRPGSMKPATLPSSKFAPSTKGQTFTAIRRPLAEGKWWSASETKWQNTSISRRRILSHIGRIMEGDGEATSPPCATCEAKGLACYRYTAEVREKYTKNTPMVKLGDQCAYCRFIGKSCTIPGMAPLMKPRARSLEDEVKKLRKEIKELREENKELRSQLRNSKRKEHKS